MPVIPHLKLRIIPNHNIIRCLFTSGATTRLSFHIYSKTELFTVPQGRYVVNSKVAAARLERNGRPVVDLGDDRVTVVLDVKEVGSNQAMCGK